MEFYIITLEGMKKLLHDCNENNALDIISNCLDKWTTRKNVDCLIKEFSENGFFKNFGFNPRNFQSPDELFWTQQLFDALVAMAIELAKAIKARKNYTIEFIRKHFGHDAQIINGTVCSNCGFRQINMQNVDEYISVPIISKRIVDGLEKGSLDEAVEALMTLSAPEIKREREHTKARIINTSIPFSQGRVQQNFCLLCGGKDIKKCKFLKSLKKPVFVPLSV